MTVRVALAHELSDDAPPQTDEDLVARVRAGDSRAFEPLVQRYQRPIFGLVLRYVRNPDDARDLAQRAFVRAFTRLGGFRSGSSFKTWLYKIAVNLALNHIRDRKPQVEIEESTLVTDAVGASRLVDAEARARLRQALDELPPKQRLVVELRVYEELSFREVAQVAGCSENAAKVNFHHAVRRLKERFQGALP